MANINIKQIMADESKRVDNEKRENPLPKYVKDRTMEENFTDAGTLAEYILNRLDDHKGRKFKVRAFECDFGETQHMFGIIGPMIRCYADEDTSIIIMTPDKWNASWRDKDVMYYDEDGPTICDVIMRWAESVFPSLKAFFYEDGVVITASYAAEYEKWKKDYEKADKKVAKCVKKTEETVQKIGRETSEERRERVRETNRICNQPKEYWDLLREREMRERNQETERINRNIERSWV